MAWEVSDWSAPAVETTDAPSGTWLVSSWSNAALAITAAEGGSDQPSELYAPALAAGKGRSAVFGSGFSSFKGGVYPFSPLDLSSEILNITFRATVEVTDVFTDVGSGGAEVIDIDIAATVGGADNYLQSGVLFIAEARGTFVALSIVTADFDTVTVERVGPAGAVTLRGGLEADISGGLWNGYDFEAPQGVPLVYRATLSDGVDTQVAFVTATGVVDYGGDWLMPVGRTELGTNIIVEKNGIAGLTRDVIRDVVKVVNRPSPTVVSWGRSTFSGQFTFLTLTDAERIRFQQIIDYPTLMFVARPGFGFEEPVFLSVGSVTEYRTTGMGSETSRRWVLDVQEIARPPALYVPPAPTVTWGTWEASGDTWGDIPFTTTWFEFAGFPA